MQVTASQRRHARFGSFTVDLISRELSNNGHKIHLQEKPFQILALLLDQPGELVTREEFRQKLWPSDTFVDFEHSINTAVKKLREALDDNAEAPRFIETLPRRGYRFIGQLEETIEEEKSSASETKTDAPQTWQTRLPRHRWYMPFAVTLIAGILLLVGLNLAGVRDRWLHGKITEHDTILLADFANKTGDPVFDDALKPALAAELGQSPFLNLVSDRKIVATLRMMGRDINAPVTVDVARELCQRTGSKAVLDGTISSLGTHYLIHLDAVACATGDSLAKEEAEAESKEDVLKAMNRASSSLRSKLGESLPSVQKFDVPFEATTSSLEALRNYSMGIKVKYEKGDAVSIPFLERAVELDPNFASAYSALAIGAGNLGKPTLSLEYATKAYQLRDRVTEREKMGISASYFHATGEEEKLVQTYQQWKESYPRDFIPYGNLGIVYNAMGLYEKALVEYLEAGRLRPDNGINYGNLASAYVFLNRFDEAQATLDEALAHKLDGGNLRAWLYIVAFLREDKALMEQQLTWGAGKPGDEEGMLSNQSDTEAYYGRLRKARELTSRAVDLSVHGDSREAAAMWQIGGALREAELGNFTNAKQGVKAALAFSSGRDIKVTAALALARSRDAAGANAILEELEKKYPTHTMLRFYWLPTIRAVLELNRGNSSQALADLQPAAPYELGLAANLISNMYPVYVRGQAYLLAHDGRAAAAEFQKMLDHKGVLQNFVIAALVRLQIGRAYAMAGDTAKAKAAYHDFLALWKDADPDTPILKEAKAEYAKLQ
jgi:DNA-binding winged helix-turn-helix (wHTH) protein